MICYAFALNQPQKKRLIKVIRPNGHSPKGLILKFKISMSSVSENVDDKTVTERE